MNYTKLAKVIRQKAEKMLAEARKADPENYTLDDSELLHVLARILEGKEIHKAFGAPGDWGYSTSIGAALYEAHKIPFQY